MEEVEEKVAPSPAEVALRQLEVQRQIDSDHKVAIELAGPEGGVFQDASGQKRAFRDAKRKARPRPPPASARPPAEMVDRVNLRVLATQVASLVGLHPPDVPGSRRRRVATHMTQQEARRLSRHWAKEGLARTICDTEVTLTVKFDCARAALLGLGTDALAVTRFASAPAPQHQRQPRAALLATPAFPLTLTWLRRPRLEHLPLRIGDQSTPCYCPRCREDEPPPAPPRAAAALAEPAAVQGGGGFATLEARMMAEVAAISGKKRKRVQRVIAAAEPPPGSKPPPLAPKRPRLRHRLQMPVMPAVACPRACGRPRVVPRSRPAKDAPCAASPCTSTVTLFCRVTGKDWCRRHWETSRLEDGAGRSTRTVMLRWLVIKVAFFDPHVFHVEQVGAAAAQAVALNVPRVLVEAPALPAAPAPLAAAPAAPPQPDFEHGAFGDDGDPGMACVLCNDGRDKVTRWDGFEHRWLCSRHFKACLSSQ
jgi:hypothetical protein